MSLHSEAAASGSSGTEPGSLPARRHCDTQSRMVRQPLPLENNQDGLPPGGNSPSPQHVLRLERAWLKFVLRQLNEPSLRVVLWDGTSEQIAPGFARHTIVIHDRAALWKLLRAPDYYFLEGYASGQIDVQGDMNDLLCALNRGLTERQLRRTSRRFDLKSALRRWTPRKLSSNRDEIAHHYDVGNDFYQLWLDDQLLYTCAYFERAGISLEDAQIAKMDHICRKLQLRPGQRVVEAGCGWGALALHMARRYGVTVRAYNISQEQLAYARERARREGMEHQVEFVEGDWREIAGTAEAFVSVGMLEHVRPENFHALGKVIRRTLTSTGRGLIHTIGMNVPIPLNSWIERRIFPGAQPPTLRQMMDLFEPFHLSVLDVENLRLHYAETLKYWLERFEEHADQIRAMFDERFLRTWRAYLASSMSAFETGGLHLYQVTFAPGESNDVPMTRAHLHPCAK